MNSLVRLLGICATAGLTVFALLDHAVAAGGDYNLAALDLGQLPAGTVKVHIFGLVVGEDGSKLPPFLEPDYVATAHWWDRLDVTEPMYIAWELHQSVLCDSGCAPQATPTKVDPPRPLAKEDWFATYYNQLYVKEVWTPAGVGGTYAASYVTCPDCVVPACNLEAPGPPGSNPGFTPNGALRIADVFGGIGTLSQIIMWTAAFPDVYVLSVRWNRPATYTTYPSLSEIEASPGAIVDVRQQISFFCNGPICTYETGIPQMTVEWPSADFPPATPRFVDAQDISAFSAAYGSGAVPIIYGFDSQGGPSAANFKYNLNPFGQSSMILDSGDISVLSFHLGKHCALSKAGNTENAQTILDWFGIGLTGRQVVAGPGGETIPEYDIRDPEQNRRAQVDPYGYRSRATSSTSKAWGKVKELYR